MHAKVGCFDQCFVTCGSANLVDLSMAADHTETNLHVWSVELATQIHAQIDAKLTLNRLDPATYALD
ncbi:MAG: phosphatidylserine/phosphatidylglycerophosphate/cardiolipin synthase-like enzyme [Bradymonadia bacterium]